MGRIRKRQFCGIQPGVFGKIIQRYMLPEILPDIFYFDRRGKPGGLAFMCPQQGFPFPVTVRFDTLPIRAQPILKLPHQIALAAELPRLVTDGVRSRRQGVIQIGGEREEISAIINRRDAAGIKQSLLQHLFARLLARYQLPQILCGVFPVYLPEFCGLKLKQTFFGHRRHIGKHKQRQNQYVSHGIALHTGSSRFADEFQMNYIAVTGEYFLHSK